MTCAVTGQTRQNCREPESDTRGAWLVPLFGTWRGRLDKPAKLRGQGRDIGRCIISADLTARPLAPPRQSSRVIPGLPRAVEGGCVRGGVERLTQASYRWAEAILAVRLWNRRAEQRFEARLAVTDDVRIQSVDVVTLLGVCGQVIQLGIRILEIQPVA